MAVQWWFPTITNAFLLLTFVLSAVSYDRPPPRRDLFLRPAQGSGPTSPQQVHISLVGDDKMRVSWITSKPSPPMVYYGTSPGTTTFSATGTTNSYRYLVYRSGLIHEVVIGPLNPNTVYYYRCGFNSGPPFTFKTAPARLPIKLALVGDLGQTGWTKSTLDHISKSDYDVLLLPGDLSYADFLQPLWDSFGRLVEPLASKRPWMVTQGNHEVEKIPLIHGKSFTAYNARWHMPFEESGSDSNLYYSFELAGSHVVMLGSYTDFGPNSAQYKWLQADLRKVDRVKTPWLFVLVHAPWYNSNAAHQREPESIGMKEALEDLLYQARVDIVFSGHVHAYERFAHVYKGKADECGAVYITIGDGGNREGLARRYMNPKPDISKFREGSFGHGELEVINGTHALWTWHRNDNDEHFASDSVWFISHYSNSACRP